ncbi:hypothetical protein CP533_6375 [Ophiocordyceps camponoti-saundersi (nom. inval.)]|nr:hypothetical protein CP533_6375 [Ophiocordyceps camponoti-saundersi (nom. inval.)]
MAQPSPSQPLSAAHGIRSLQDDDAIYHAFDSYPWSKDKTFLSGLSAILGESNTNPNPSQGSPHDIATHARIFYYAQRIGVQIDYSQYKTWLSQKPDHQPPNVIPDDDTPTVSALPWQQAAPKAELYLQRPGPSQGSAEEPRYPLGFAEVLKLIREGKPIHNLRQIPNTIVRDPVRAHSVKPVGSRKAPRKPWEKDTVTQPPDIDDEFPAIQDALSEPLADHESPLASTQS